MMRQHNIFKNLIICLMILFFVLSMVNTSFADSLISFSNGTMYQYDDGSFAKAKWVWVDNNNEDMYTCHYFDAAGMMLTNAATPDGKRVNAKGQLVENGQVVSMRYIVLNSKLIEGPIKVDVPLGSKKEDVLSKLRAVGFSFNISIENYRISYLDYDGTFVNYLFNEADICIKITKTVMCNDFAASVMLEKFLDKVTYDYTLLNSEQDRDGIYFSYSKNNIDGKTNFININKKDNHDGYFVVEIIETMG